MKGFPLAKEGLVFVVPSLILSLLCMFFHQYVLFTLFFCFFLFSAFFFRNPERSVQSKPSELISPADGRVMGVDEMHEAEFLDETVLRIAVFMGPGDVHVNRAPCDGTVRRIVHRDGQFRMAFKKESDKENERNYILLEKNGDKLLVVQIAGFLARRIHCWVQENDVVRKGGRIGMIAFGSRVDLYTPLGYESVVKLGERVKAGLTVLARKKGEA
ncbi:MAG: Phosphatidylserine decarboxylase [Deltaproteobacteria bacterium]|nr:Phosphatidylserine decarboxylase [Deltaproteobacteria bacterium]